MPSVSGLTIKPQSSTDSTLFASWTFKGSSSSGGSSSPSGAKPKKNDRVKIKSGAKWYNGTHIPSWVMSKQWIVLSVSGSRAVINKSTDGKYSIMSPINVNNLTVVGTTSSGSGSGPSVSASTVKDYTVHWWYNTGDGVWFDGGESTVTTTNAIYSMPSNAVKVKVKVTPNAKTYKSGDKDVPYWTGTATTVEYVTSNNPPSKLSAPSVTLDKYKLKATIENIEDAKCDQVEFEVVKDTTKFTSGTVSVVTARASFTCNVTAGAAYRVRIRAINLIGNTKVYSEWSPYSSEVKTIPQAVTNLVCTVTGKTSVKLTWTGDSTAKSYKVEYTTKKEYFDTSNQVSSITVTTNTAHITGLETGKEWYFRVQAVNEQGETGWSDIIYKIVGTEPEPPTTWSLTTTAVIGEDMILYWVHNTEDGSKQTGAQIELMVNGQAEIITVDTSADAENEDVEEDKIYSYVLDTSKWSEGAEILWRVRTKGVAFDYSEWSIQREIDIYAPPTLELHLGNDTGILTQFPFSITAVAGPVNQKAITYHVGIFSEDTYTTLNDIGEEITVIAGQEVYAKTFIATSNNFAYDLMPEDIILDNNRAYNIVVTVSMDSGLTAEASGLISVLWSEQIYEPTASTYLDRDLYCAYILPVCFDDDGNYAPNVVLSIFRRESDGTFTEIISNIDNDGSTTITDPHPSLDYARYRIVARNRNTNVISFTDLPGIPFEITSIIIQWDEKWSVFDYTGEDAIETPAWNGSRVILPYDVDVNEKYDKDTSLIEYIGRSHPVGYYGTQKGWSGNWTTNIPKHDKETIYALRRLANWAGDVYVREPSGIGYRANINVSMSMKHKDPIVPVSLEVKRVEGEI